MKSIVSFAPLCPLPENLAGVCARPFACISACAALALRQSLPVAAVSEFCPMRACPCAWYSGALCSHCAPLPATASASIRLSALSVCPVCPLSDLAHECSRHHTAPGIMSVPTPTSHPCVRSPCAGVTTRSIKRLSAIDLPQIWSIERLTKRLTPAPPTARVADNAHPLCAAISFQSATRHSAASHQIWPDLTCHKPLKQRWLYENGCLRNIKVDYLACRLSIDNLCSYTIFMDFLCDSEEKVVPYDGRRGFISVLGRARVRWRK